MRGAWLLPSIVTGVRGFYPSYFVRVGWRGLDHVSAVGCGVAGCCVTAIRRGYLCAGLSWRDWLCTGLI